MGYQITNDEIMDYRTCLIAEELSDGTVRKYVRDVQAFRTWLGERALDKAAAAGWKEHLMSKGYAAVTVNAMLSSLNRFFGFMGWQECRVKFLRIQRRIFRNLDRELSREEYEKLLATAQDLGNTRLKLLMETICATGIRV